MFRDFVKVFSATGFTQVIELVKGFFVVKYLDPSFYGLLKILEIIKQLAKYGNLGFIDIALREIPFYRGRNEITTEQKVRNNAYSCELLLTSFLTIVAILLVFYYKNPLVKIGIICSALVLFLGKIERILSTESTIQKQFAIYSNAIVISSALDSVLIIGTISFWGVYAPLIIPVVVTVVVIFYLIRKLKVDFKLKIDKVELKRQIKVGLPFALKSNAYGVYQWAERGIIASFLGLRAVGLWGLAHTVMTMFLNYGMVFSRIWYPNIMEKLGRAGFEEVKKDVIKIIKVITILSSIIISLAYINLFWFIQSFLPKYIDSILLIGLFLLAIYFWLPTSYISIILSAPTIDKQVYVFYTIMMGIIFFVGSSFILKFFNLHSLVNLVIVDVLAYLLMSLLYFRMYLKVVRYNLKEIFNFVWQLIYPGIIASVIIFSLTKINISTQTGNVILRNLIIIAGGITFLHFNFDLKYWAKEIIKISKNENR
ncbi:MAG: oligosaccharide flippase family protein [Elusimicrobiota bacterium]